MAREDLDRGSLDRAESALASAEKSLDGLDDADAAPVRAEIAEVRAKIAAMPTEAEARGIGAAQRELRNLRSKIQDRQDYGLDVALAKAVKYVADVRPGQRVAIDAEIATARAEMEAFLTPNAAPTPPPTPAPTPTPALAPTPPPPPTPTPPPPPPAPVTAAAPPAPPAPAASASIDDALQTAESSLKNAERDLMFESSFDPAKFGPKRKNAEEAIAAVAAAAADHPKLVQLRARHAEMVAKADKLTIDAFKSSVDSPKRSARRDLDALAELRKSRSPKDIDPASTAKNASAWVAKVRKALDEGRDALTSEAGRAAVADVEAWIAATEQEIGDLALVAEAFALFRAEVDVEGYDRVALTTAMDSVEWNWERDPLRVVLAWDAVKKLIGAFQQETYARVPEVQSVLERHAALAKRVDAELRPKIAKLRVEPLIRTAHDTLELLKRDTDNLDEDRVIEWRKRLREHIAPLQREWADVPDAEDFLRTCKRAMARSEEALGDKIVLREIQAAEVIVKPLVERVERGLALASATRVKDHAPRLRARLAALDPFLEHQRASLLKERAEAALGRIESVLGATIAREIAEAETVPAFEVDLAADTKVQAVLTRLNKAFAEYKSLYDEAQEHFEEDVDLETGGGGRVLSSRPIESAAREMIRYARLAEEIADELRKVDRTHAAVAVVEEAIDKLVKRAQTWEQRLAKKVEYAEQIARAYSEYGGTKLDLEPALRGDVHDAITCCRPILNKLRAVDEAVAAAGAILPDDHDEADAWGARAGALRKEVTERLISVCVSEASRRAQDADVNGAQTFAAALAEALPDAPENAQIAAVIAGTADARQKAMTEIHTRGAMITRRAEEAAKALRPVFEEWAVAKKPLVALAGTIVKSIDDYVNKWIAGSAGHLGRLLYDHTDELNGDMYQFDYDPHVREHLLAGMKRLDDLYAQMAEKVVASHAVAGINTTTQHYPSNAQYLCEIVGITTYTPKREVRDNYGRVLGTIDGNPYPIPRLVIRGVATSYFVIVPGHPPSLDAMKTDGLAD